jgi:hypothetical protein
MSKTAMQELIEALDIEMKERGMFPNWNMYLEKEKEQIAETFEIGISEAVNEQHGKLDYDMSGEIYYNQTYNQNKG